VRRAAGWLWHDHEVPLPGWIIALGAVWALDGVVKLGVQIARWLV
jgi:hypothetical protein